MTGPAPGAWLGAFAALLAAQGFGTWRTSGPYPVTASWPIHLGWVPPTPGPLLALFPYGGAQAAHDYEPLVQVRVRGDTDPRTSHARAEQVWAYLHFLTGGVALSDGSRLVCAPSVNGAPFPLGGPDELGRHTHITNHHLTLSR